jgi:DNA-binding winged helix-turn-helix (wHTH) protein/pimeloyl-ACP methyl ester carboxylesterase
MPTGATTYTFEDCEVDTGLYELRRSGRVVHVEPQVFDILTYLVEHHDRVVTKDELIERFWPERYITEGALNTRLMAARRAIGDSGDEQRVIRTLPRRGYRFIAPVVVNPSRETERAMGCSMTLADSSLPAISQSIEFCRSADGVRIAYARSGDGPPLVKAANWLSHLEFEWDSPVWRHWMRELSTSRTLIRYDERGCGLSDWNIDDFSFDAWVHDLEAVVDAAGVDTFALLGISQGAGVAISYAVRYPERVSHLILYGAYSQGWKARAPSRRETQERQALLTLTREGWGRDNPAYRQIFASFFIPGASAEQVNWFNDLCRVSTSPENAVRFMQEFSTIDVDELLPRVSVPTLVIHARNETRAPFEEGRKIASRIEGARFVPVESANHILLEDEPAWRVFQHEVRQFLS